MIHIGELHAINDTSSRVITAREIRITTWPWKRGHNHKICHKRKAYENEVNEVRLDSIKPMKEAMITKYTSWES